MDMAVKNKADQGEKAKALQAALAQIEKQFGKGTIMRLGEGEAIADIQVVSTGSLGLDIALGAGGHPRGRGVENHCPDSSGKTTPTLPAVSYTHPTLPTKQPVQNFGRSMYYNQNTHSVPTHRRPQ